MPLTLRLLNYLDRQTRAAVWGMVVASLVCLGIIDYLSGAQITIAFFYLLPVSLASWELGRYGAGLVALASAITMQATDLLAGGADSNSVVVIWNTLGRFAILLAFAALLRQLRVLLDQQTTLARRDPLTGVLNRRAFFEAAHLEVAKLKRHRRPLTVLFIDVDDFKALNDTRGHLAGDMVLKCIAEHMEHEFRGTDVVGRMGGDEYAALLPEMNAAAAQQAIPRLQTSLTSEMAQSNWPVTFSMGVLTCDAAPRDAEAAIDGADRLMYAAKARGGNCVKYACFPDEQKTVPVKRKDQP